MYLLDTDKIELLGLETKSIYLNLPPKCVNVGHRLTLFIHDSKLKVNEDKLITNGKHEGCVEILCKVEGVQVIYNNKTKRESSNLIKLNCVEFDKASWDEISARIGDLQSSINKLFSLE